MAAFLPKPTGSAETEATADAGSRPYPWRPLLGICAISVFGGVVFYTVPVEMALRVKAEVVPLDRGADQTGAGDQGEADVGLALVRSSRGMCHVDERGERAMADAVLHTLTASG
jgi:hypothetical protein